MKNIFAFDLDSTITREELLPRIACLGGIQKKLEELTQQDMNSPVDFEKSFKKRVDILKHIPISAAAKAVGQVPLNTEIVRFIRENTSSCLIVTGNLDVWIRDLIRDLNMEGRCLSSKAEYEGDRLRGIKEILDKGQAVKYLNGAFTAIGDGSNDIPMLKVAKTAIGFGGVRELPSCVTAVCHKTFVSETELCRYLRNSY